MPVSGFLSPVYSMLSGLEVQTNADKLNKVVNHPEVYKWLVGTNDGSPLDLTGVVKTPGVITLLGTLGGFLFQQLQPGLYEGHSQVLPTGRGKWALLCAKACLHWMFTRTDAVEIMMRCPVGNLGVLSLARAVGGIYEFTNLRGWVKDGQPIAAHVYSLKIQDWMRTAPGLVERGKWFHRQIEQGFAKHGAEDRVHPEDDIHDRYVGAACEMLLAGSPQKAVVFYNRWASMAGYHPIAVTGGGPLPLMVDIGSALLTVGKDSFEVTDLRSLH